MSALLLSVGATLPAGLAATLVAQGPLMTLLADPATPVPEVVVIGYRVEMSLALVRALRAACLRAGVSRRAWPGRRAAPA